MFGRQKKQWESAEATILLVNIIKVSSDGLTPTREWVADVRRGDGSVTRLKLGEPRWVVDFWPPDAGAVVKVLIDPASGAARFDVKNDARLTMKGQDRLRNEAVNALLQAPPGTFPSGGQGPAA